MPFPPSLPENAGPPLIYTTYPDIYGPWSEMSEALMNGASAFDAGQREVIFALAAGASGSFNVYLAHSQVAYAHGVEDGLLDRLLEGEGFEKLEENFRPVARYSILLGRDPNAITQSDADAVFAAGWDERSFHDMVAIAARAVFMHRLTAGMGFKPISLERARERARERIAKGYLKLYPELAARKT